MTPSTRAPAPNASTLNAAQLALPQAPSFEAVFREMAPYVLRVLPRMGVRPADVDDVAQEVFLAVHQGLPTFEQRSQLRTWVYGICIRTCSNYRRRAHRRHERAIEPPVQHTSPSEGPERRAHARRALEALDVALEGLPLQQRSVFVLHEVEGLDMREVAAALACSKFTAYARLYAARRHITRALHEHEPRGER
jgi:RNA polymerase sigma-70 factor (ECF subfamily)